MALLAAPAHGMNMRVGQQSGSATSGSAYAACVSASPTSCTASASIYVARALTYSTSTGVFTGTLTGNGCPTWASPVAPPSNPAATKCSTQTFPAPAYTGGAIAAPIVGVVGYSLNGMNMCVAAGACAAVSR